MVITVRQAEAQDNNSSLAALRIQITKVRQSTLELNELGPGGRVAYAQTATFFSVFCVHYLLNESYKLCRIVSRLTLMLC